MIFFSIVNILESSKVHSEEERVLPDMNKKRRLKTPAQVEALEKFYNGMSARHVKFQILSIHTSY